MKKSILFFLITFISISLLAQDDSNKSLTHEIGINATSFIKNFFSLNSSDVDEGDYMLTYKKHNANRAFRLGLGGRFSQVNEDIDGGGKLTTKDNFIALRVGYEWKNSISQKWNIYYGLDAIADFTQSNSSTNAFLNTGQIEKVELISEDYAFGGGPILGIQFFISDQISLTTEGSLYFRYNNLTEKEKFQVQSQFNKEDTSSKSKFDFGLPTALFFTFWF